MARPGAPAIRARWPQRVIAWWREHAANELDDALRGRAELDTIIGAASPTEWLDIALHAQLLRSLRDRCGPEGFARAYMHASDHALRMPLFEGMIRPLVRLAGRRALIRGLPRGWDMIMRGCGDIAVVQAEVRGASDVVFERVPIELARDEAYRESIASVLEALMERGGFPGTVVLDVKGADGGTLRYRLTAG